jgi:glycosyltransferase involved in cell wall biosynthesis
MLGEVQNGLNKFRINYDHIPRLDISELIRYYRAADTFVLPSRQEAAGMVLIEAMSCGLPVISSSGGGAPEIVGDAGLYFSPGNSQELARKLSIMIGDESLRRLMSESGRRRAEAEFSYLHMASRYLEIYRLLACERATMSN